MQSEGNIDVLVIGAGAAGLVAWRELQSMGLHLVVFGSPRSNWWTNPDGPFDIFANRVGGRVCTRKTQSYLANSGEGTPGDAGKF